MNSPTVALKTGIGLGVAVGLVLLAPRAQAQEDATAMTRQSNASVAQQLPFQDSEDFEDARRGFVATLPDATIRSSDGRVVWSLKDYEFLKDEAPPTVNPSLWRVARLNLNHGLFKVTDRIYQIRGFDISNMDIIEGDTGLIVIDPLISAEVARAGLELYYQPAPGSRSSPSFTRTATSTTMAGSRVWCPRTRSDPAGSRSSPPRGSSRRRSARTSSPATRWAAGRFICLESSSPRGNGGKSTAAWARPPRSARSRSSHRPLVKKTGETRTIDGVEMTFQMAPRTEAPAEFLIHFPQFRALCAAEDATHMLHNLYTLRGAQVRDAKSWWKTLNESVVLFGGKTDVVFAQHQWPTWGQTKVLDYLRKQRDLYKYIHDQSLRLMTRGYTMSGSPSRREDRPNPPPRWRQRPSTSGSAGR